MNFIQRAWRSVTRKKGKSIILFLVIFVLGNVIAGAVAIQQSTKNVEEETKKKMGAVATAELDYEKWEKAVKKDPSLEKEENDIWNVSTKDIETIGKLPYVKNYDYSTPTMIGTNKLKSQTSEFMGYGDSAKYHFTIKGTNRKDFLDLSEKKIKISEGESLSDSDLADKTKGILISKEIAEKNNLSVGDDLAIDVSGDQQPDMPGDVEGEMAQTENSDGEESEAAEEIKPFTFDYPVKVQGIFQVIRKEKKGSTKPSDEQDYQQLHNENEQINTIYASNKLASDLNNKMMEKMFPNNPEMQSDQQYYASTFVLKSPEDAEAFRQEANAILPEYQHVILTSDQYDEIAGPIKKLDSIAKYVVIFASIATLLIISLVVLLFLRDRKKELGIYLSLGEAKGKIMGQIAAEVLMISVLALILSLITGNFLGKAVSDTLMQSDWINGGMDGGYTIYGGLGMMDEMMDPESIKSAYQVRFTPLYVITYLGISLGTILLSAVLPLVYILRLNPKKIMM